MCEWVSWHLFYARFTQDRVSIFAIPFKSVLCPCVPSEILWVEGSLVTLLTFLPASQRTGELFPANWFSLPNFKFITSHITVNLYWICAQPRKNGPQLSEPSQICSGFKTNKWIETRTDVGTFAISGSQWASYLRVEAVVRVAAAARAAGTKGAALWALDLDDWRGECACGPNPVLRALRQGLLRLEAEKMCLRTN